MADKVPETGGSPEAGDAPNEGCGTSRVLTIVNRRGLHARASARFVQTAERFDAALQVSRDGLTVGGQSIMGLMMLAAGQGSTIHVSATGPEAAAALEAIAALVDDAFGEER